MILLLFLFLIPQSFAQSSPITNPFVVKNHVKEMSFAYPTELPLFLSKTEAHAADYFKISVSDFREKYNPVYDRLLLAIQEDNLVTFHNNFEYFKSTFTTSNSKDFAKASSYFLDIIILFEFLQIESKFMKEQKINFLNKIDRLSNLLNKQRIFFYYTNGAFKMFAFIPFFHENEPKIIFESLIQETSTSDSLLLQNSELLLNYKLLTPSESRTLCFIKPIATMKSCFNLLKGNK